MIAAAVIAAAVLVSAAILLAAHWLNGSHLDRPHTLTEEEIRANLGPWNGGESEMFAWPTLTDEPGEDRA